MRCSCHACCPPRTLLASDTRTVPAAEMRHAEPRAQPLDLGVVPLVQQPGVVRIAKSTSAASVRSIMPIGSDSGTNVVTTAARQLIVVGGATGRFIRSRSGQRANGFATKVSAIPSTSVVVKGWLRKASPVTRPRKKNSAAAANAAVMAMNGRDRRRAGTHSASEDGAPCRRFDSTRPRRSGGRESRLNPGEAVVDRGDAPPEGVPATKAYTKTIRLPGHVTL